MIIDKTCASHEGMAVAECPFCLKAVLREAYIQNHKYELLEKARQESYTDPESLKD